jgi:hypothetical protein
MVIYQGQIREVRSQRFFTTLVYPSKIEKRVVDGKRRAFKVPSGDRPLQMTAYMAHVELNSPNLPQYAVFPVPLSSHRNRFQLFEAEKFLSLFADLELLFPINEKSQMHRSVYSELAELDQRTRLAVRKHYVCKTLSDVMQIRNVNDDTIRVLKQFYDTGYAFLVVEFSVPPMGADEVARTGGWLGPIMYVHEVIGVVADGRPGQPRFFLPTRHYLYSLDEWTDKYTYKESDLKHDNPFDAETETLGTNDERMMEIYHRRRAPIELLQAGLQQSGRLNTKGDKYIDQAALIAARAPPAPETLWDHQIYVLNTPRVTRNPLFVGVGVHVTPAHPSRLAHAGVYFDTQKMPKEIIPNRTACAHRVEIDSGYKYKLDLWI